LFRHTFSVPGGIFSRQQVSSLPSVWNHLNLFQSGVFNFTLSADLIAYRKVALYPRT
jgi:hypothetical protein